MKLNPPYLHYSDSRGRVFKAYSPFHAYLSARNKEK
jgi:hypothetical protein